MRIKEIVREEVKNLYEKHLVFDFPQSELKPVSSIESYMQLGIYDIYGLYEEQKLMAYAMFMKNKETGFQLLDYFASTQDCRGQGFGSYMLQLMREIKPHMRGNLIEVETVRTATNEQERIQRERRIAFYLKNGVRKTKLRTSVYGVEFDILYMPLQEDCKDERLQKELNTIYLQMLGKESFKSHITIEAIQ